MFIPGLLSIILITSFPGTNIAFLRGWGKSHCASVVDVQVQCSHVVACGVLFRARHLACGVKYIEYLDG